MDATPEQPRDPDDSVDRSTLDPEEELKSKFREALSRKHSSSGASKTEHVDTGEAPHPQNTGPTHKVFRRKTG
jgi:hypothetical protein